MTKKINFSPPFITKKDIHEVVSVLKSGWITTGPKVKEFEKALTLYTGSQSCICTNSATSGLEIILRTLGIGKGDEVITTPYTFTATASVIHHVGAKVVFADITPNTFHIDPLEIKKKITKRTKAIISVDYGGLPCDYTNIYKSINSMKHLFTPNPKTYQRYFKRPILIADSSHAIGASYKEMQCGALADFSVFSFHAVKNISTAEGGAILLNVPKKNTLIKFQKLIQLYRLHGQDNDAFKRKKTRCQYDVLIPGYKANMTDIQAALGISQLKRFHKIQNLSLIHI